MNNWSAAVDSPGHAVARSGGCFEKFLDKTKIFLKFYELPYTVVTKQERHSAVHSSASFQAVITS